MSLGTIHPNLYKTNAEDIKSPIRIARNLNVSVKHMFFIVSFLLVSILAVSTVFAASSTIVSVSDGTDRIVGTGQTGVVLQFNVTSRATSTHTISTVNITNATDYIVTAANATGNSTQACTIAQLFVNCPGLGNLLAAGNSLLVNLTVTTPNTGSSGIARWFVNTNDTNNDTTNNSVATVAIDGRDIAFDVRDELDNVTRNINATVQVWNKTALLFYANKNTKYDAANDGLFLFDSGVDISNTNDDSFTYNITSDGFATRFPTTNVSYGSTPGGNGVKPAGLLYALKISVTDELGNALSGYSVNITSWPTAASGGVWTIQNTTGASNTTSGNIQFFALRNASFHNVSINMSLSGFINNGSYLNGNFTNGTFPINTSNQTTGNSTYVLPFVLKVNVTDELGAGAVFTDTTNTKFTINNTGNTITVVTANRTSNNIYYFSIPNAISVYINASKTGYVNSSFDNIIINSTVQAYRNPQLPFRINLTVVDELGSGAAFTQGVIIALNNTTSTANSTSRNTYYFNITDSVINVSVAKIGYINSTNVANNYTNVALNSTTQAGIIARLNFSVRVTDLCNELGGPGHCFAMDGTLGIAELSGNGSTNTTYSGADAYINASNGVSVQTVLINGSKNGFVNRTITIRTNQTHQVRIVFNNTDQGSGANDRADGLPFTFKVLSVFDELGARNFTLNNSDTLSWGQASGRYLAGVDIFEQANNTFYNNVSAGSNVMNNGNVYVNATGTSAVQLVAFLGNQSLVNSTKVVTPNPAAQQTILYNASNQLSANLLANGLNYTIKITVQDELGTGNSSYMNSGVTIAFNTSGPTSLVAATPDATSANVYYFANQSWILSNETNFTVSRIGYINTSSPIRVPINASNQTSHTIQLPFNLKVAANDELGQALGGTNYVSVNFTLNNTGLIGNPNATSGAYAYWAVTIPSLSNNGTAYVNMSKIGYVDNATAVLTVNSTNQTLANQSLLYTVRVFYVCDEINASSTGCFNINGNLNADGTATAEISGIATNYSGGVAYIPLSNYTSGTVTVAARGYVNQTVSVIPTANRTAGRNSSIAFNMTFPTGSASQVNGSALQFTVRVQSICDQLNYTCFRLNGSEDQIGSAGINISISPVSSAVNSTRYNNTSIVAWTAYVAVPHGASANLTAFSLGYINSSQSVTGSASSQTTVNWNSTIYGLNYTVRLNVQNELTGSENMNSGVLVVRNVTNGVGTLLTENQSYFRSSPNSNVYYINVSSANVTTGGGANITVKRDGYINTSSTNYPINSTGQANMTLNMPFSVKVNSGSVTGVRATVTNVYGNITYLAVDGNSSSDTNSTADGVIYWALNQTLVAGTITGGTIDVEVDKPENQFYNSPNFDNVTLNYATQLSLSPTLTLSSSDTTAPLVTITSIAAGANVTSTTPVISFNMTDVGGTGIDISTIAVNMSGFSVASDCGSPAPSDGSQNISCSYTVSSALTDAANHTISIAVSDMSGNAATNATRSFGVDTRDAVTATLNTSDTSAIADNTYANGWSFTFNVTLGSTTSNATDVNATAVKVANWTRVGGTETISTAGNTIMNYTISNGTAATYYVSHGYNTTGTIYPLQDLDSTRSIPINGTVTIYVKVPASTVPGTYATTFTFGSWSVSLSAGGNPT